MLYETPALDTDDLRVLAEIEDMRTRLRYALRAQPRWSGQLRRNLTARAIAGSNTIEGYAATVEDVEALMTGEEPLETEDRTRVELEGYQRAMAYIQALADGGSGSGTTRACSTGCISCCRATIWTSGPADGEPARSSSPARTTRWFPRTQPRITRRCRR